MSLLGEGDLTKRLDVGSRDELGQLALWFSRYGFGFTGEGKNRHKIFDSKDHLCKIGQYGFLLNF